MILVYNGDKDRGSGKISIYQQPQHDVYLILDDYKSLQPLGIYKPNRCPGIGMRRGIIQILVGFLGKMGHMDMASFEAK